MTDTGNGPPPPVREAREEVNTVQKDVIHNDPLDSDEDSRSSTISIVRPNRSAEESED